MESQAYPSNQWMKQALPRNLGNATGSRFERVPRRNGGWNSENTHQMERPSIGAYPLAAR